MVVGLMRTSGDTYLQQKFYHSHTNIYSLPTTWNQWFCLHWYNLILSYQHIWKPLTLQWCPIEDTDTLHQCLESKLEKKGCPKHMVIYGYQCSCLHWRIWHIIHIDMMTDSLNHYQTCILVYYLFRYYYFIYGCTSYYYIGTWSYTGDYSTS